MLRLTIHLLALLPFFYYVQAILTRSLGADPQEVLLHGFGIWALRFLLLSLAITPLRKWLKQPWLVQYRRMLGLYFFFYLCCHLVTYLWFFLGWDASLIASEIVKRPYITVGVLAFVMTVPLVVTSTKGMQRRLKRGWSRLHSLVYGIGILSVVHFIWQSKADLNRPLIYTLILALLLTSRIWWKFNQKRAVKAAG